MIQNVTLSAEKELIERARQRAEADHTTLNAEFRRWLEQYAERPQSAADLAELMARLSYAVSGRTFTRAELNER
jgi:hypothetical protein